MIREHNESCQMNGVEQLSKEKRVMGLLVNRIEQNRLGQNKTGRNKIDKIR